MLFPRRVHAIHDELCPALGPWAGANSKLTLCVTFLRPKVLALPFTSQLAPPKCLLASLCGVSLCFGAALWPLLLTSGVSSVVHMGQELRWI